MRRPRVIHYISELDIGGTERQLLLLLPELQRYTDNHVVCALGAGPIGPRLYQHGIPVHYLGGSHNFDLRPPIRLRRLVRQIQPDILTSYLSYADLTARIVPIPGFTRLVSSQRSSFVNQPHLQQFDRLTKSLVHHYVCQTPTAHQQITSNHRLASHQCSVIPNAVRTAPSPSPRTLRQYLRLSEDATIITSVSTLKKGKGHSDLLSAFQTLNHRHPHVHLLLVGDGPLREDLYRQAQTIAPDHIHFLGHQDNITDILASSDIFALPTHGEGMSNALLEAMAAGLPIVTTNILPNQDLIKHEQTGLLCPTADISCLTDTLHQLITDPELRHRLGHQARQYVLEHHPVDHIASRWFQLYQTLLDSDD